MTVESNQASVVQMVDSAIQRISAIKINCVIQWIVIYPADSAIHQLNNWGQMSAIATLGDWLKRLAPFSTNEKQNQNQ